MRFSYTLFVMLLQLYFFSTLPQNHGSCIEFCSAIHLFFFVLLISVNMFLAIPFEMPLGISTKVLLKFFMLFLCILTKHHLETS